MRMKKINGKDIRMGNGNGETSSRKYNVTRGTKKGKDGRRERERGEKDKTRKREVCREESKDNCRT